MLGRPETLVAACAMGLSGPLGGQILLIFEDRSGLALADLLLHQPMGTTTSWGELEQSAAQETTNIVGCAYLNALAAHLPGTMSRGGPASEELVPTPPTFLHEFAGSLLEFALMEQALELDKVLLVQTTFASVRQGLNLNWTLLFIPDRASLHALASALTRTGNLLMPEVCVVPVPWLLRYAQSLGDRLRGHRPVGGRRRAGEDPDAAGLVRGGRFSMTGWRAWEAWATSCCPTPGDRPSIRGNSRTRPSPP